MIGKLDVMEAEFRALAISLARAKDRARKLRLVRTVREMLRFQAEPGMRTIMHAANPGKGRNLRPIIELQAGLARVDLHGKAIARHQRGGKTQTFAYWLTQDEIMIVEGRAARADPARQAKVIGRFIDSGDFAGRE